MPSVESAAETIVDIAATLGASRLILGAPQRNALVNILRGNIVREVSDSSARRNRSARLRLMFFLGRTNRISET